jgi:hypothetical protein
MDRFWAESAPAAVPDGIDALMPPWAQQLSLVGLLILIVAAFMRDWVISSSRHEKEMASERKVSEVWEQNATRAIEVLQNFTEALEPVLRGNDAILKAVSEIQDEQRRYRNERGGER